MVLLAGATIFETDRDDIPYLDLRAGNGYK